MKTGRGAVWLVAVVLSAVLSSVLAAVFSAYLKPDVAMTLANQLWACF